ncbi:hypothetical protein ACS79_15100 [Vibrio lentus]|nr:hypothetical protein ACS79_15100 [Vibrio lentus]
MSKKKLTEKELLEGMTPYNAHSDLLAKPDWLSFSDVERVSDDFMANRNEVFDESCSDLVNPDIFLSNLKLVIDSLPDDDIELCDLSNEIGRVIVSLNSSQKCHLRDVLHGIEHGFNLIAKAKGVENE